MALQLTAHKDVEATQDNVTNPTMSTATHLETPATQPDNETAQVDEEGASKTPLVSLEPPSTLKIESQTKSLTTDKPEVSSDREIEPEPLDQEKTLTTQSVASDFLVKESSTARSDLGSNDEVRKPEPTNIGTFTSSQIVTPVKSLTGSQTESILTSTTSGAASRTEVSSKNSLLTTSESIKTKHPEADVTSVTMSFTTNRDSGNEAATEEDYDINAPGFDTAIIGDQEIFVESRQIQSQK